tara:strand:- start:369 stop:686 length:318 start_codon:yes stop_codon:yes gene_type:complete
MNKITEYVYTIMSGRGSRDFVIQATSADDFFLTLWKESPFGEFCDSVDNMKERIALIHGLIMESDVVRKLPKGEVVDINAKDSKELLDFLMSEGTVKKLYKRRSV